MELVAAGPRGAENHRRLLDEIPDALPGGAPAAILPDHLPQVPAHHFVDGCMLLGSHRAGSLEQLFLDRKGHVQPRHLCTIARIPCTA